MCCVVVLLCCAERLQYYVFVSKLVQATGNRVAARLLARNEKA